MPLPGSSHKAKNIFPFLNPGERGGKAGAEEFHNIEQPEHNLRQRNAAEVPASVTSVVGPAPIPQKTQVPRTAPAAPRDWHKFSDFRLTVSKKHIATSDPEIMSDAFDTISAAITFAKSYYAKLSLIYTNPRITIEVHGGLYDEQVVIDVSYLDFEGIGNPQIKSTDFITHAGIVDITSDCERVHFDGFEILTSGGLEGSQFWDSVGLHIAEGLETSTFDPFSAEPIYLSDTSDIWISNCWIHGTGSQLYSERYSYLDRVRTYSEDNYDNAFSYASAICRVCVGDGTTTMQTKWTRFNQCVISGQSNKGDPTKRGQAFAIAAYESDFLTWVSNSVTGVRVSVADKGVVSRTGVTFEHSTIIGWGENFGWALDYFDTRIIGGKWINDTGAGSVHLLCYSRTHQVGGDPDVSAYTWWSGGHAKVNYLSYFTDNGNILVPAAKCEYRINGLRRSGFTFAAGTELIAIGGAPLADAWAINFFTAKAFVLGGGPIEAGSIINTQKGIALSFFEDGYMNV